MTIEIEGLKVHEVPSDDKSCRTKEGRVHCQFSNHSAWGEPCKDCIDSGRNTVYLAEDDYLKYIAARLTS